MSFHGVTAGIDVPNDINVIIEIAANSTPVKYEVDKDTGTLKVDRMLSTAMFYPCNYGYVPQTLCDDGDPIDVMVATPLSQPKITWRTPSTNSNGVPRRTELSNTVPSRSRPV